MALNPKHQAFVSEFLKDRNGTQAAIRAGYSSKGASVQATRLLANVNIRAEIAKATDRAANKAQVTLEEVIGELKLLGFSDPALLVDENGYQLPLHKMPPEMRRCISSIELGGDGGTRIKFWPKNSALELLGKHLGLKDKVEISGPEGGPVPVSININRGKK